MSVKLQVDLVANIDDLINTLKNVETKFSKLGDKLKNVGKGLSLAVTAPILAIGAVAANEFQSVEKGLREINSLFGLTGDEAEKNFGMLSKVAEQASKELGILQSELVPAMYNAISAGVPKDNVFDFIKVAGKAAIGGVTDLNTSVDGLTSIINAFGLSMTEVESVADSIFAAIQGGKTTFSELSDSIFNIAPAAAAAGVSFKEVNAAIATLTASGTPTSVATTQMRAALTGLQRPSEDMNKIFQNLGFESAQFALESKGLSFAINAVKTATKGNNGQLIELLGSTEAVAAANVLAGTGASKFTEELERQANAAGSANKAAEEINKSFSRELERTKVATSNLAINIGNILAPALSKLNNLVEKVISFFGNLSPTTQTIVVAFAGLAAAVGPILLGIGGFISLIPTLIAGLTALKTAIGSITLSMAAATAGVSLLVYGLVSLSQELARTSKIKAEVQQQLLAESLKETASEVDQLAKKYSQINTNLTENESKLKANNDVLESYKSLLKNVAKTDPQYETKTQSIKANIDALQSQNSSLKSQIEITKTLSLNTLDSVSTIQKDTKSREERVKILRQENAELLKIQKSLSQKLGKTRGFDGVNPTETKDQVDPNRLQMIENASASILALNKQIASTLPGITIPEDATQRLLEYGQAQNELALNATKIAENMNAALFIGDMFGNVLTQLAETGKVSFQSIIQSLIKLIIKLAAAVASALALNILTGGAVMSAGGAGGAKGLGALLKGAQGMGLTPFANGGIVSGPTPALVGEYTGAKTNPEVIAPLNKLQNMMGGNVNFTISGDNLVGTLNRANKTRSRKF